MRLPCFVPGVTTFNALRSIVKRAPATRVAILGIGGLGHLAVQYAAKAGLSYCCHPRVVRTRARSLSNSARTSISDSTTQDPAKELQKIGGANIILSTVTSAKALDWVIDGLGPAGKFIVVGAPDGPVVINPFPLLLGRRTAAGWPSGTGHGFGRHTQLQRAHRCQAHDRNLPTRKG